MDTDEAAPAQDTMTLRIAAVFIILAAGRLSSSSARACQQQPLLFAVVPALQTSPDHHAHVGSSCWGCNHINSAAARHGSIRQ
eukprot:CAMPEP_0119101914 /NCGR_PEP_ID=MMETSP1180-20130426/820_1 /TAXON_ID=3052 ORGANISM="Chlamydomonas cf sp, Strain CCMP681" /NCGR_SAMPLE_ID=MMETSP1180 /ASSEMBLY_ACC=CAM_ASM_000741 /LENGTH=82 /DNA_ID=CAMNT_0007086097 /DNA_START=146 /DNA_END=394 /DNA_ORIENTATION=+